MEVIPTIESGEISLRCRQERARSQNSWLYDRSSGQRGYPAELSQLTPWPAARATVYCTSFPSHQSLALAWLCLWQLLASQLHLLFGPCCPSQCCLLDHRLNQEPISISPVPALTGTWLVQSWQPLWRAKQDKSQAWWWSTISYWSLTEVVCYGNKMSYLAPRCSRERWEGHSLRGK